MKCISGFIHRAAAADYHMVSFILFFVWICSSTMLLLKVWQMKKSSTSRLSPPSPFLLFQSRFNQVFRFKMAGKSSVVGFL